jgi:hypothetical protein
MNSWPDDRIIQFLLGEEDIDGLGFGEKHPDRVGMFWWRSELRGFVEALTSLKKAIGSRPLHHQITCTADEWHGKHPLSCDIDNCAEIDSDVAYYLLSDRGSGTYELIGSTWEELP